ncbi:MAG: tRNA-specific adenosine deaminase [Gammaproteobacteria bacterium]|nr:tRNA-specific adenosine deaminase [Gammaproteobacteria bacterium]MBQ09773.1 tRNA-specific adenosine deaminase [Gammaproteobacteria bacterium]
MKLAYDQAQISEANGEVPVGALYFNDNQVIAKSGNVTIANNDPAGHAEIAVLRAAAEAKSNHRIGGTLVVTLEPCIMCMGALIQARVETLIFGAFDPRSGAAGSAFDLSDSSKLNHKITVIGGVMENQCKALIQNFFKSRR